MGAISILVEDILSDSADSLITDIFYGTNITAPVANITLAHNMQSYILGFIHSGDQEPVELPGRLGLPDWPPYGAGSKTMDISATGYGIMQDPWEVNGVCAELLKIVKDPRNGA